MAGVFYLFVLETYREYKKVKSQFSGEGSEEKKMKPVHFEDGIECLLLALKKMVYLDYL